MGFLTIVFWRIILINCFHTSWQLSHYCFIACVTSHVAIRLGVPQYNKERKEERFMTFFS